ncbi:MAG: Ldh family oxidoreductase [Pseudomonadota bacterium]
MDAITAPQFETHSLNDLQEVGTAALINAGVNRPAAEIQVSALLAAELKGHASHGLLRLPRLVRRIRHGVANPNSTGKHQWVGRSLLQVDGGHGLGPVVAQHAIDALTDRLDDNGIALAAISKSNHIGMLAYYAERMARNGQIAIILSTSEALVHPYGGRYAMLGTNPIAIGVPAGERPFVLDMATSKVSMGKIHHYSDTGQTLDVGWALDGDGNPTTDATAAKAGAIAPFGGPKGYALGLAFEVLVGALTQSALGTDVVGTLDSDKICNKGDLIFAIKPHSGAASASIERYLDAVRSTPAIEPGDKVSVPGDRSAAREAEILENGITLPAQLAAELRALSD